MYDIQQLLKKYGIFVYTGDRQSDIQLMQIEIDELYKAQLLNAKQLAQIKGVLLKEMNCHKNKGRIEND